eukprot:12543505-Heterocapsa_arctica.AAC.1
MMDIEDDLTSQEKEQSKKANHGKPISPNFSTMTILSYYPAVTKLLNSYYITFKANRVNTIFR